MEDRQGLRGNEVLVPFMGNVWELGAASRHGLGAAGAAIQLGKEDEWGGGGGSE